MDDDDKAVLIFCLFLVGLVVLFSGRIYRWVDSNGMFPHDEEVSITASGNWFVGESKVCSAYPLNHSNAKRGSAISLLNCDDGPKRQVRVQFWGRRLQPEYQAVYWKCGREESGFTCSEIYGDPVMTVEELGRRYKRKYPAYNWADDADLGRRVKAKYPEYYGLVRDITSAPQTSTQQPTPLPPSVGAVVRGYRFKGGDPAAKSSWEMVDSSDEVKPEYKEELDKLFGQPTLQFHQPQ